MSGGSFASWSVTCAAKTVAVHTSAEAKSTFGLSENVVGPPVTTVLAGVRVPLVGHAIWNQVPVTFTGSLKVIVRLVLPA